jgi:hypothetical protein
MTSNERNESKDQFFLLLELHCVSSSLIVLQLNAGLFFLYPAMFRYMSQYADQHQPVSSSVYRIQINTEFSVESTKNPKETCLFFLVLQITQTQKNLDN